LKYYEEHGKYLESTDVLVIAKDTIVDFALRGDKPFQEFYKIVMETSLRDGK
jgi:hypothetical protein